ncbi:hypothetical protein ACFL6S_21445 [Candidatus Poribacteria bacterium]
MQRSEMSKCRRLEAAFALEETDRTPILGGWIACPEHIMELTGAAADEYWADPTGVSVKAYGILEMDGLIGVFVPRNRDDFRCVDNTSYAKAAPDKSLEQAAAEVDAMPTPEEIEANFD